MALVKHFTTTDGTTVDIPIGCKAYLMQFTKNYTAFQLWHGIFESGITADHITDLDTCEIVNSIPSTDLENSLIFVHLIINNKNFYSFVRKEYQYNSTTVLTRSIKDTLRVEWSTPLYVNIEVILNTSGSTINALTNIRIKVASNTDSELLDGIAKINSSNVVTFDTVSGANFFVRNMRAPRVYFEPDSVFCDYMGTYFTEDNGTVLTKPAYYIFGTYGSDTTTYFKVVHTYRLQGGSTLYKLTERFKNTANSFNVTFDNTATWGT